MSDIREIIEQFEQQLEQVINGLPYVSAEQIGLDRRAGRVYVNIEEGTIITKTHNTRNLEYYGGFEYIDNEHNLTVGSYKIYGYHDTHSRIENAIEHYEQNSGE